MKPLATTTARAASHHAVAEAGPGGSAPFGAVLGALRSAPKPGQSPSDPNAGPAGDQGLGGQAGQGGLGGQGGNPGQSSDLTALLDMLGAADAGAVAGAGPAVAATGPAVSGTGPALAPGADVTSAAATGPLANLALLASPPALPADLLAPAPATASPLALLQKAPIAVPPSLAGGMMTITLVAGGAQPSSGSRRPPPRRAPCPRQSARSWPDRVACPRR